jgi:hypothetical protein
MTLEFSDGKLRLQDDLQDYEDRGDSLADAPLFQFLLDTYEGRNDRPLLKERSEGQVGRPRNDRVYYKEGSGREHLYRMVRSAGHETMPNFIGKDHHLFCVGTV